MRYNNYQSIMSIVTITHIQNSYNMNIVFYECFCFPIIECAEYPKWYVDDNISKIMVKTEYQRLANMLHIRVQVDCVMAVRSYFGRLNIWIETEHVTVVNGRSTCVSISSMFGPTTALYYFPNGITEITKKYKSWKT